MKRTRKSVIAMGFKGSKPMACGPEQNIGKIPTRRYIKDVLLTDCVLVHPEKGWKLNVTPERCEKWIENHEKLKEVNHKIPLAKEHEHRVSTKNTAGYVDDPFIEGDKLYYTVEARGAKNIELTETVDQVSVYIENDFKDAKGNVYDEVISHISLTPQPVWTEGQGGFMAIAASRGQQREVPCFALSADGDNAMPMSERMKAAVKKLGSRLKIAKDDTEDQFYDKLEKHFEDADEASTEKQKELDKEKAAKVAAEEQVNELKKGGAKTIDPELAESHAQIVGDRINSLVKDEKIPPAVAASLKINLCGTDKARDGYMLSRVATADESGARPIRAMQILDCLEKMTAMPKLGEGKDGKGGKTLSRQAPGEEPEREGDALTTRMVGYAKSQSGGTVL